MLNLAFFVSAALLVMFVITVTNVAIFPRLQASVRLVTGKDQAAETIASIPHAAFPKVSVLIPARNEANHIEHAISSLLAQTYPNYEIRVLDDHSDDNTYTIANAAANGDPRLSIFAGAALPVDWMGKNWACQQLAQLAQGEILIFTDADVRWQPVAISALVAELQRTQADLLTVWPRQITQSWGERLVVPLGVFAVLAYLPIYLAHNGPWPLAAAANGQCMVFRRHAYQQCGGHAGVRSTVLEDVRLAQSIKAVGLRLRLANGANLLQARMYEDWQTTRNGYAKNILAGYGNSRLFLALSTIFHLTVFVGPWLWLILGWLEQNSSGWPLWPLALILLGLSMRGLTALATRQRLLDALFMPISALLMTRIAAHAVWWQWRYGGPQWKGRTVHETPISVEDF
ncbi:hydroxychlorobactene glucosyltransferase CruC [soil metagenome]